MADDITLPGTGKVVKTIEKSDSKHVELVALDIGATTTSTPLVAGQGLMAASVPVAIASNQSAVPVTLATAPALVASSAYIGNSAPDTITVDVTLSLDTNIYAIGDVLAATQEVAGVARASGTGVELVSMVVRDKDDQAAAAMSFYFFDANVALGTENSAPSISDADADALCGMVTVPSAAWVDLGGVKVASLANLGLLMHPATGTSLWIAATTAGTPTQSASGITLTLQFIRY